MVTGNNFCIDYCNLNFDFANYFVISFGNYHLTCDNLIYYMNYFLIYCLDNFDFDCLNNFYFYYVNSFYFYCTMNFVIDCWKSVYSLGLIGIWIRKQIVLYWNLIVNCYFGYFGYSIDYICFVRNFVYFLVRVIYLYNLSYVVIGFLCNLSYLEVVLLNCYYYIHFCSVDSGLFSCLIERLIWFFCAFEIYSDCLVVFVYIRKYCVRIVGNNYTSF